MGNNSSVNISYITNSTVKPTVKILTTQISTTDKKIQNLNPATNAIVNSGITPLHKANGSQTSSSEFTKEVLSWTLGGIVVLMIFVILLQVYRKKQKERKELSTLGMKQIDSSKTPWREIDKGFIATGKELGSGFFGVVLKGTVILDGQSKQCAVKMLKEYATEADNKDLINELHIIARVGHHPNIINVIGACTKSGPAHIVLEFAANGNLLDFLRKHQNTNDKYPNVTTSRPNAELDLKKRLKIAYEVAQGMRHLSSRKCVHRDLAARNVLLDEHMVAKVTDFGLSRDVYQEGVYKISTQSKMPLKWMAIESLEKMTFTSQSDVWSFAILMWEIETAGATPYPGLMGRELFYELAAGHRLNQPPTCPDNLYELMSRCWIRDPSTRPSFQELCVELESFLQTEANRSWFEKVNQTLRKECMSYPLSKHFKHLKNWSAPALRDMKIFR